MSDAANDGGTVPTCDDQPIIEHPVFVRVTPKADDPVARDMAKEFEEIMNSDACRSITHFLKYGHFPHD